MMKNKVVYLFLFVLVFACRKPEPIIPSTDKVVTDPADPQEVMGFFLLNEGNMGNNKSTLDYFDYTTGEYIKNIYAERNPNVVKELGDVGNDIQIYRDKLYAVINCSHFVEVMDVNTARHITQISIPNCRYIIFKGDYAYVSSYAGPVQIDPNARLGYVVKVDVNTLKVVAECTVGYQPEEMVIVGDRLYVANSGGYRVPNYDRTVSVVDLNTFTEIKKIDVAVNMHRLELDNYGMIWASSRGDYYNTPSKTFVIDPATDTVVQTLDIPNSNMTVCGDSLYVYSTEWSYVTNSNKISFSVVDTRTREVLPDNFIKDGTEKNIVVPYGLAVNPETREIYVTDATNYVTPGKLHCYSKEGRLQWSVTTGDIPAHIVFTDKKLQSVK